MKIRQLEWVYLFLELLFLFYLSMLYILLLSANDEQRPIAIRWMAAWVVGVLIYFFLQHILVFRNFGVPAEYYQFKRVQDWQCQSKLA